MKTFYNEELIAELDKSSHSYTLLPSGNGWRQVLIMPSVALREDGISLNKHISSCILWMELSSGKIGGLTIRTRRPFLSLSELELIAKKLETAQALNSGALPHHLAKLFAWYECNYSDQKHLREISENLIRETILFRKEPKSAYLLTSTSINMLSEPCMANLKSALRSFNTNLDQDVLHMTGMTDLSEMIDVATYNYLFHQTGRISLYRRQAVNAFPLLNDIFAASQANHRVMSLKQSIDSGNPLLPVLTDYLGGQKSMARFLAGKDYTLIGEEWQNNLEHLIHMLKLVKPDFWPKSECDWQMFNQWLRPIFYALFAQRKRKYPELLQNGLNHLVQEGYGQIPRRLEHHGVTLTDIVGLPDFAEYYYGWARQTGKSVELAKLALQQVSILKVTGISVRWHEWLVKSITEPSLDDKQSGKSWLSLIDSPWIHDRYTVVPLNNSWQLKAEGELMHHCVGTYTNQCLYYGAQIFSIREQSTGSPLSTVELSTEYNSKACNYSVVQHYGRNNSDPPKECHQVLNEFLNYLHKAVGRERNMEIQKQIQERRLESQEYCNMTYGNDWPQARSDQFKALLRVCPALTEI